MLGQVVDAFWFLRTGILARVFHSPALDEFLGVGVKVLFMEWRRVHRIEQLGLLAHFDFDAVRGGGFGSFGLHSGLNLEKVCQKPRDDASG
jgi:hypothetical protein